MPEVQEQGGQGEAKGYPKSGEEEAKGGEEMTREDVVQAALKVERWCAEHYDNDVCDCPFSDGKPCWFFIGDMPEFPCRWGLEDFLRTRGLKHDD